MTFAVEFYETRAGASPVRDFLDKLKTTDPDDFAVVMAGETKSMKKTNFDRYLEEQLNDPAFAERFKRAGEAWDVALQIAALRQRAGLSQKDLAKLLKTSQQQISRMESPAYEGHSLSMLRRVAEVLHAHVRVTLEPRARGSEMRVAEEIAAYGTKRTGKKRK